MPESTCTIYDLDEDGCPDDIDGDGVIDEYDDCPTVNSQGFDGDLDGCVDDDGDGIGDNVDICETKLSIRHISKQYGLQVIDANNVLGGNYWIE